MLNKLYKLVNLSLPIVLITMAIGLVFVLIIVVLLIIREFIG